MQIVTLLLTSLHVVINAQIGIYEFNVKNTPRQHKQYRDRYLLSSTIILRWVKQIRICSNSQFSNFQTGCILDTEAQNCLTILEENWSHDRNIHELKDVNKHASQKNLQNKHIKQLGYTYGNYVCKW